MVSIPQGLGPAQESAQISSWPRLRYEDCPACGHRRCRLRPDGSAVWCYRREGGPGLVELRERARRAPPPRREPSIPPAPPADDEVLDRSYHALIAGLPLLDRHRAALHARGLSDEEILRYGYRSLPARAEHDALPAFDAARREAAPWANRVPLVRDGAVFPPALVVPVCNVRGQVVALVRRPDDPGDGGKYRYPSGAPTRPHVARPSVILDGSRVWITEGVIKADVAAERLGSVVIGLPGVDGARAQAEALDAVAALGVREVVIAYDADLATNAHVLRARDTLAQRAAQRGLRVALATWPLARGKGLDDLLVAGHRPNVQILADPQGHGEHVPERPQVDTITPLARITLDRALDELRPLWPTVPPDAAEGSAPELTARSAALGLAGWLAERGVAQRLANELTMGLGARREWGVVASTWRRVAAGERVVGQTGLVRLLERLEDEDGVARVQPVLRSVIAFVQAARELGLVAARVEPAEVERRRKQHEKEREQWGRVALALPTGKLRKYFCFLSHCGDLEAQKRCPQCQQDLGRYLYRCERDACSSYCAVARARGERRYLLGSWAALHRQVALLYLEIDEKTHAAAACALARVRRALPKGALARAGFARAAKAPGLVVVAVALEERADAQEILKTLRRFTPNAGLAPIERAVEAFVEARKRKIAHFRRVAAELAKIADDALAAYVQADDWLSHHAQFTVGSDAAFPWPSKQQLRGDAKDVADEIRGTGRVLDRCYACARPAVTDLAHRGKVFLRDLARAPSSTEAIRLLEAHLGRPPPAPRRRRGGAASPPPPE